MKHNPVNYVNFPESGALVWFAGDSSAGGLIADKNWIPAIWLGVSDESLYLDVTFAGSYAKVLIEGKIFNNCHISRFHLGDSPPDEGDAWV